MEIRGALMPLTSYQLRLARLMSKNRAAESHLAGAAALNLLPLSDRYSADLDYFQDSVVKTAEAFNADIKLLKEHDHHVDVEIQKPGFFRAIVSVGQEQTKVEWLHDTAWRFMPPIPHPDVGFQLHPIDLAVNKILACAGRNEPRDFVDALFIHRNILPLGAICWAAVGKDPGFSPSSLLEMLKRRGRFQPEEIARLALSKPLDLTQMKTEWLNALDEADIFFQSRPSSEVGCLYYSKLAKNFIVPSTQSTSDIVPHFGKPGGTLPKFYLGDSLTEALKKGNQSISSSKNKK